LKLRVQSSARALRDPSNPSRTKVFAMIRRKLAIAAIAAACSLGLIDVDGADSDAESPNPPRTQQQMMKERYAACRDLHGSALKHCMANYVGTPGKNLKQDEDTRASASSKHPGSAPRREDGNAAQVGAASK
jgi:hypothetical protein